MLSKRKKAYLDAMGIGVWSLREQPPAISDKAGELPAEAVVDTPVEVATVTPGAPGLKLGPGGGGVLLVCAEDSDSASRLANDIDRALGKVPVWAWSDRAPESVQISDAVAEHLFTTVAIFGDTLTEQFFGGDLPANLHGANLVQLPAMQDITRQPQARRALWKTLCRAGMVSSS